MSRLGPRPVPRHWGADAGSVRALTPGPKPAPLVGLRRMGRGCFIRGLSLSRLGRGPGAGPAWLRDHAPCPRPLDSDAQRSAPAEWFGAGMSRYAGRVCRCMPGTDWD